MTALQNFLNTPFGSFIKVTLGVLLAALLDYVNTNSIGLGEPWDAIVKVIVIAAVPIVINYLNPADSRYGRVAVDDGGAG